MATTTRTREKALGTKINGKSVYVTPTGVRVGKGKVTPAGAFFAALPKGHARRLRKALRAAGRPDLSGAPRG